MLDVTLLISPLLVAIPYNKVCGMAVGYQSKRPDGFATFSFSSRSINGPYV